MHLYADVINLKEKNVHARDGGEEGRKRRGAGRGCEGVVGEEEGVMASACSLGNLSNLESCQDTERLCTALPLPLPCVSVLAHE